MNFCTLSTETFHARSTFSKKNIITFYHYRDLYQQKNGEKESEAGKEERRKAEARELEGERVSFLTSLSACCSAGSYILCSFNLTPKPGFLYRLCLSLNPHPHSPIFSYFCRFERKKFMFYHFFFLCRPMYRKQTQKERERLL